MRGTTARARKVPISRVTCQMSVLKWVRSALRQGGGVIDRTPRLFVLNVNTFVSFADVRHRKLEREGHLAEEIRAPDLTSNGVVRLCSASVVYIN